jgi:hypothetical protein
MMDVAATSSPLDFPTFGYQPEEDQVDPEQVPESLFSGYGYLNQGDGQAENYDGFFDVL